MKITHYSVAKNNSIADIIRHRYYFDGDFAHYRMAEIEEAFEAAAKSYAYGNGGDFDKLTFRLYSDGMRGETEPIVERVMSVHFERAAVVKVEES